MYEPKFNNSIDVLLAEDNAYDANLTIRALKKHSLVKNIVHTKDGEVAPDFIFASGKCASSRLHLYAPRVILLDINMPKLNRIEVLKKIKTDPRTKLLPVVILTSSNENPDIQKCYDVEANSYIIKPVNSRGFTEAIKTLGLYGKLLNQPTD